MTTLIAVYNSDGCVGRCDARCYDAKHDKCECICGGKNHGAGRDKAVDNVREYAEKMVEEYATKNGLTDYEGMLSLDVAQRDIFGDAP